MYSESGYAQLVVHYTNGETDIFNLYAPGTEAPLFEYLQEYLSQLLNNRWLFLQLPEETVCINTDQVNHIEVKPSLPLRADSVLGTGERVTALTRTIV